MTDRSLRLMHLWEPLAVAAVVVVAAGLRYALLGTRSLWFDEGFSLEIARRTVPEIWAFLPSHDAHPIGYYALLSVWIHRAGTGLVQIRLPSFVFGLGAVVLTWGLGRALFSPLIGIVAAALVAVNPFQILASDEARMYSLLASLGLAATWVLWRASRPGAGAGWWIAYGAAAALLLYTSYYALFLMFGHALWIATSRSREPGAPRDVLGPGIAAATALVLYLPWLPALAAVPGRLPWRPPITLSYVSDLITTQTYGGYVLHLGTYHGAGDPPLPYHPLLLPFVVLLAAGALTLGRAHRPARSLIGLTWLAPLVLVVAVSLVAAGIVHLREALLAVPASTVALLAAALALTFVLPAVDEAETNPQVQTYRYYFDPPNTIVFENYVPRPTREGVRAAAGRIAETLFSDRTPRVWLVYLAPWPPGALEVLEHALTAAGFRQGPTGDFNQLWVTFFIGPRR